MRKLLILLIFMPFISLGQTLSDYNFPLENGSIKIDTVLTGNGDMKQVFKGLQEFFAVRYFDQTVTVKAKSDNMTSLKIIDKPILYQDQETGKLIGHCWLPLKWHDHNYTFVVFKFEGRAFDGKLSYILSNFEAVEVLDAPRSKGAAIGGVLFSASSGVSSPTISKAYPLEKYITEVRFPAKWLSKKDNYAQTFKAELEKFQSELSNTIFNK